MPSTQVGNGIQTNKKQLEESSCPKKNLMLCWGIPENEQIQCDVTSTVMGKAHYASRTQMWCLSQVLGTGKAFLLMWCLSQDLQHESKLLPQVKRAGLSSQTGHWAWPMAQGGQNQVILWAWIRVWKGKGANQALKIYMESCGLLWALCKGLMGDPEEFKGWRYGQICVVDKSPSGWHLEGQGKSVRPKAKEYFRSRLGHSAGGPDRKAKEGSTGCTNDTWGCESKQFIDLISQEELPRRTALQGNRLCHCPAARDGIPTTAVGFLCAMVTARSAPSYGHWVRKGIKGEMEKGWPPAVNFGKYGAWSSLPGQDW